MTKEEKKAKAAAAFKFNKDADTIHVADDGECFPVKNDAHNHASKFKDKTIETFTRNAPVNADASTDDDTDEEKAKANEAAKAKANGTPAEKK